MRRRRYQDGGGPLGLPEFYRNPALEFVTRIEEERAQKPMYLPKQAQPPRNDREADIQADEQRDALSNAPMHTRGASGGPAQERDYIETFNASGDTLARLDSIEQSFGNGELFRFGPRMGIMWDSIRDRFGIGELSEQEMADMDQFYTAQQSAYGILNDYIKNYAGAQVSGAEQARMMAYLPNIGTNPFNGDSPQQFLTKLRNFRRDVMRARIRASLRLAMGGTNTPLDFMSLEEAEQEYNRMAGSFMREEMEANPRMSEYEARTRAQERLAEELGL